MALELIQIIEDDPQHAQLLDYTLRQARYRTNVTDQGVTGLADIKRLHPALILLDVMLPGMDGYEVCRRVREDRETNTIPIIMVSALGSEEHRLNGFKLGIDDYIGKPFSPREVLARVKAVLQRASPPVIPKESYVRGDLVLEGSRFSVSFRGIRVELTAPEWTILRQLAESPGSSVPREVLVSALWGEDGLIHEHELERIIQGLRQKFESGQDRIYAIPVVPEIGFRLSRLTPPHRPSSEG